MKTRKMAVLVVAVLPWACGGKNPTGPSDRPPVIPVISVSPSGVALAGVTRVSFNASTTDPDGDALLYTWVFGDGGTGSGAVTDHVFAAPGTYTVSVTITDGKTGSTTTNTTVGAKNISGSWTDADPRYGVTFSQSGSTCSGTVYAGLGWGPVGAIENCTLTSPRNITFFRRTYYPGLFAQCTYSGSLDDGMDHMSVRCSSETVFSLTRDK